jgi:hypothetical protein
MHRTSKPNPHNSMPDGRIISLPMLEGCGHELGLCGQYAEDGRHVPWAATPA